MECGCFLRSLSPNSDCGKPITSIGQQGPSETRSTRLAYLGRARIQGLAKSARPIFIRTRISRNHSLEHDLNNRVATSQEADLTKAEHASTRAENLTHPSLEEDIAYGPSTQERNATQISRASSSEGFVPWTMDQAFLVICGGLVVHKSIWGEESHRLLTSKGVVRLAKLRLLPKISRDDVRERIKTDAFAKFIACIQVIWFLIQSFARIATKLPLTLLEVHTITHIACALTMYGFWWTKPCGIETPILIDDPRISNFATLLRVSDEYGERTGQEKCALQYDENIHNQSDEGSSQSSADSCILQAAMCDLRERRCHISWQVLEDNVIVLTDRCADSMVEPNGYYPRLRGRIDVDEDHKRNPFSHVNAAPILFSGLYGGSHLGAWAFHFPSSAEMWMWRASGIILCTTTILTGVALLLHDLGRKSRRNGADGEKVLGFLMLLVMYLFFKTYGYARMFILVESLVSLRSPANGTYETIDWTQYIPHLS